MTTKKSHLKQSSWLILQKMLKCVKDQFKNMILDIITNSLYFHPPFLYTYMY